MKLFANILLAALVGLASSASLAADEHAATPNEAAAAPAKPAKPDPAKGDTLFSASTPTIQSCASCHGADGNSGIRPTPSWRSSTPSTSSSSCRSSRAGKRKNPIMQGFAAQLSDQDMRNIAAYVGTAKKAKTGFARTRNWSRWARRSTAAASPTARSRLRRLPQPQRRRHPGPVPAPVRPARRLHRGRAAHRLPRRRPQQQPQMTQVCRQAERPRNPRRGRLHRRPALTTPGHHAPALN
jgi:cytochrome c553